MEELYELWETAESLDALPDLPALSAFTRTDEVIDVGYDCFIAPAYVSGPYCLQYDEESYGRDRWGWSATISYMDGNRSRYDMVACKCQTKEDAYRKLAERVG